MARVNKGIPKKRGRPPTGRDPVVPVRLPESLIKEIDGWGSRQSKPTSSRSEAVRRLVEHGIKATTPMQVRVGLVDPTTAVMKGTPHE